MASKVGIKAEQLRDLVERVLAEMGMSSPEAIELVMGTAAQESHMGRYIRQMGGPALGVFQCEPTTFEWLRGKYRLKYPWIDVPASHLEWDLRLAITMCRLRYRVAAGDIPTTLEGQAQYWKTVYNTKFGKGTVDEYIKNYQELVC